jgi:hypothetical protein
MAQLFVRAPGAARSVAVELGPDATLEDLGRALEVGLRAARPRRRGAGARAGAGRRPGATRCMCPSGSA